jgi:hypothetical protein
MRKPMIHIFRYVSYLGIAGLSEPRNNPLKIVLIRGNRALEKLMK